MPTRPLRSALPTSGAAPYVVGPVRSVRWIWALATSAAAAWVVVLAGRYRGLAMDDAYIGFRYVANLLAGVGFVFQPGPPVEGVTNAGYLLALTPVAALLDAPRAAHWLGALASLGAVALSTRLAWQLAPTMVTASGSEAPGPGRRTLFAWLVGLAVATHAELLGFSLLGMETGALAVVLSAIALGAARAGSAGPLGSLSTIWMTSLGTMAFTFHPEAGLVLPAGALIATARGQLSPRRGAGLAVGALAGIAAVTVLRWSYFGSVVPNTFVAKPTMPAGLVEGITSLLAGGSINLGRPFSSLAALALAGWGAWLLLAGGRRSGLGEQKDAGKGLVGSFAVAIVATGLAFAIYARPDWTGFGRYFAPYAPAAFGLLACALWDLETRLARRFLRRNGMGLVALAAALSVAFFGGSKLVSWSDETFRERFPGYVMTSASLVEPVRWMRANLPPAATVASRRIGVLGYEGGFEVFDYSFGLTEPEVALRIRAAGGAFSLPSDPRLEALWRARAPDYLLEDASVLRELNPAGAEEFEIHGMRYRRLRSFRIARGIDWVLSGRVHP